METDKTARKWLVLGLAACAVFCLALLSRIAMIGAPPIYDELYQLVPALNFSAGNGFTILDGIYERASDFTRLIVFSFDFMGSQSWSAARLIPSVIPGALLVSVVFIWVWHVDQPVTAFIAAVFLILWPNGIEVSQYIRFYALHGLLFVLATLAVYTALIDFRHPIIRAILLVAAGVLILASYRLQMLTLIGFGALTLWVAIAFGPRWLREIAWLKWAVLGGFLVVVAILASGAVNDTLAWLWTTYRWEPWPASGDTTFYHRDFRDNYPTFWPLFPVAALIALRVNFKPALFSIILFGFCFVLQTFGGLKNIRYLYPVMPFFFVIWAIALWHIVTLTYGWLRETAQEAVSPLLSDQWAARVSWALLGIAAVFLFIANAAFERSIGLVTGQDAERLLGKQRWQWTEAKEVLTPWLERKPLIVTTEEMRSVEWLGDYDVAYNRPRFSELLYSLGPETAAFSADFRTGRPITGNLHDVQQLVACYPVGVLLADAPWTGSQDAVKLRDTAIASGAKTTLTRHAGMALFGWDREGERQDCPDLPPIEPLAADRILGGTSVAQTLSSARADK